MSIKRFFDEFTHPEKKCVRVGHSNRETTRHTYRRPSTTRYCVVDRCHETKLSCSRCGITIKDWEITKLEGFNSSSMPVEMDEELTANGMVVIR